MSRMVSNTSILDCDMNISLMRKATKKIEATWTGEFDHLQPIVDLNEPDDFTHYKIEYTREEKVKCSDDGEHPTVYYTVPKGESVKCGYCNRMWIRK